MNYGLIGKTLKHSFSKEIHEQLGYDYELTETAPEELDDFFQKRDFKGINVTIPYKESVMKYLDEIDENAKNIGACNTIINKNGKLYGYNTDFCAAKSLIEKQNIPVQGKKAIILGTGGTSKTYYHALKALNIGEASKVSRTPKNGEISYEEALSSNADIIINTTPVGMYPNTNAIPINPRLFPQLSLVVDAVYNPLRTNLVLEAQKRSVKAVGGLYMLAAQGVYAAELFGKCKAEQPLIDKIYNSLASQKRNIVLIGMPGVGKSTMAELLSKNFYDTDKEIEKKYGMPPHEIIEKYGVENFRLKESEIIEELSPKNGLVIATGGGAILKEKNVLSLKKNGLLVYLNAPLERLNATNDRPLSKNRQMLESLYNERKDIYTSVCDISVDASGSVDETFKNLKEALS